MKDAAKILLENGSLENYVKKFVDDSSFEYVAVTLRDIHYEDVKEGLINMGEDLSDYDPTYDDWDELLTSEKENLIDQGVDLLVDHLSFHGDIVTKYSEKIKSILYTEIENYINTLGVDLFYG